MNARNSKEKGIYLFHLASYNDIDHIAPVIWKFLEAGEHVRCVGVSDYDFVTDYRVLELLKYNNFEFIQPDFGDKFRYKILHGRVGRMLGRYVGDNVFKWLASRLWGNRFFTDQDVKAAVFEWRGRGHLNFFDAKINGVPLIALPHGGPFTYLNDDFTQRIRKEGKKPDFSSRNEFDSVVFQSQMHAEWAERHGYERKKMAVLGAARYCKEWSRVNLKSCGEFAPKHDDDCKLKVVFFVPHWTYNVHEKLVMELLERLSVEKDIYLVVKGHTRGSGSVRSDSVSELEKRGNVEVNVEVHSPAIVKWCDIVINVSSSIAFEALIQGKLVIHASYLHDNLTIFDTGEIAHVAKNQKSLLTLLNVALNNELPSFDRSAIERFLDSHINIAGRNNILNLYHNHIISMINEDIQ